MDAVAAALATDAPLPLLGVASSLLDAFDDRPTLGPPDEPSSLPPLDEVVQSFFDVPLVETSALLAAIAGLAGDELLRRRVRREIGSRAHVLPGWLLGLDQAEPVDGAFLMQHVLGDGENIGFGVRLPGEHQLCVVVYIDHNLGTLVKDAYVVPGPLADLTNTMRAIADDPDTTLAHLDPAVARARVTEAVELSARTFPPIETDTWPACKPLVEWAVGLLPAAGTGYVRPEWTEQDQQALAERFFDSPFATGLDDADRRGLLESLLWFGTDYGPGDPLRWSPVAVEILLADWIPRKVLADARYLAQAPGLLRAFIRFSHAERGIRGQLTEETLAAVDEWEPEYQATIRAPRPQGPAALLAAMGVLDLEAALAPELVLDELVLDDLRRAVGGEQALDTLDAVPLPDEPFDWRQVPDDVHGRVTEVLGLVDRCCAELFDVELRTAARRLLARVAAADPGTFRRNGRADTAAASICWMAARANDLLGGALTAKALMGWFGVSANTPSQRGRAMLAALGVDPADLAYGGLDLGSPEYLTADTRARIIATRDRHQR